MPGRPTLISQVVPGAELLRALEALPAFLRERGVEGCNLMIGWGSDLPTDALWKQVPMTLAELPAFVAQAVAERAFLPGESDLIVEIDSPPAKFVFCHESDIHLQTEAAEWMRAFRSFLEGLGIRVSHVST